VTPPPDDEPPPKRRRKPPRGLEGFDTGYPEDPVENDSSGIPRKPLWTESSPAPMPASPTSTSQPTSTSSSMSQPASSSVPRSSPQPTSSSSSTSQPASSSVPSSQPTSSSSSTSQPASSSVPRSQPTSSSTPTRSPSSSPAHESTTAPHSLGAPTPSLDDDWAPTDEPAVVVDPSVQPSLSYPAFDPASVATGPASGALPAVASYASFDPASVATGPVSILSAASGPAALPVLASYASFDPASGPVSIPSAASGPAAQPTLASYGSPTDLDRIEPLSAAYAGAATTDGDLRAAIGATPAKQAKRSDAGSIYASGGSGGTDDASSDFDGDKPRSRKMIVVSILSLVVGLGIAALVFLGRANSASFYIACEPDRIIAQQGRSFPPWGESTLDGKQWTAIKIPPEAECISLETESENELSDQFRTALVKRASVLLTAKEVTKTDDANALLEQALLHTRSNSDASRNARVDIQRLLGDVAYWRAALKMRDASKALLEASKQFDAAAQQRPRHVTDASAWAEYVRKVVGELETGPAGAQTTFPPTPPVGAGSGDRPPAPPGVALPVEPDKGSASEAPSAPPDAGVSTGGVLL
jgi:hypothetical protein